MLVIFPTELNVRQKAVFWVSATYSLAEIYEFSDHRLDDRDSKYL
jgi:hypothetical protein